MSIYIEPDSYRVGNVTFSRDTHTLEEVIEFAKRVILFHEEHI